LKHYISDETVPIVTSDYSAHHACQCCACKRTAPCAREDSVHFNKTLLWFRFMFVSLFTAPTPLWSTHNP